MDNSTLLSHNAPRFAPPRMHVRNASQSPTRKRFADDLLSDLSPATTLEAFTNPSGKLKASIEAATPSERAFGIRATTASKKIQEWVYELSNWPWPAEGGSVGFEMPATKRRKLSDPSVDLNGIQNYEKSGMTNGDGPKYIGSLLAEEVDRYEVRIDEIHADMEDLNVEDIKRQVLDTHFSPRSRPSSSASNAPMPQFLSSYTKMDDFTAIVTSTVLQSLPNLSKLMRLIDVWSIRLSVLRKVPPLLLALEDTEIALKSGWNAIQDPRLEDEYLTRHTFNVMRHILQEKLTTLGRDLDFLLDTLEGREDTLPDSWLDRMENIENDYGSWDVAGDRKVREGEWAILAKKRKEEDDARRLREQEAAETARRKAEQEAKEEAERIARQQAEDEARRKAEREIQEAEAAEYARLQAIKDAEEAARLKAEAIEEARQKAEREAAELEAARINAEREAQILAQRQAKEEAARLKAQEEAEEAARVKAQLEAEAVEEARLKSEREAAELEAVRIRAEQKAQALAQRQAEEEVTRLKAQEEAERLEAARIQAERETEAAAQRQVEQEAHDLARHEAEEEQARLKAQEVEAARLKAEQEAQDEANRKAEAARLISEQEAQDLGNRQSEDESARLKALDDAEAEPRLEAESAESTRSETEAIARQAEVAATRDLEHEAEQAETSRLNTERASQEDALRKTQVEADATISESQAQKEVVEILQPQASIATREADEETLDPGTAQPELQSGIEELENTDIFKQNSEDAQPELTKVQAEKTTEAPRLEKEVVDVQARSAVKQAENTSRQSKDCPTCADLQDVDKFASLQKGTRVAMGAAISTQVATRSLDFEDAINPSISRYAPYDGIDDDRSARLQSVTNETRLEHDDNTTQTILDSPIHLNESRSNPSSVPISPMRASNLGHDAPATPPGQRIPRFGHAFANALRAGSASPQSPSLDRTKSSGSSKLERSGSQISYDRSADPVKLLFPRDPTEDLLANSKSVSTKSNEEGYVVITSSDEEEPAQKSNTHASESIEASPSRISSKAAASTLGYATADLTPEIQEAEPVGYFQPVLTPVKSAWSPVGAGQPTTPSKFFDNSPAIKIDEARPSLDGPASPGSPFVSSPHGIKAVRDSAMSPSAGDECDVCDYFDDEGDSEPASEAPIAHKQSIPRIETGVRRTSTPRRESISSETSTIINGRAGEPPSPIVSPIEESSSEVGDPSPSAGRIRHRKIDPYDLSPPDSPRPGRLSPQRSLQILKTPTLSVEDSDLPSTPIEAPTFDNLDVSTAPMIPSPKKATTDEQIQQQISSLLETIPARIRLTSEPASPAFTTQSLRPKKTRRSITPNARPSSTLSNYSTSSTYSRAATPGPQFTLAPAFGKTSQRSRAHNGNPEIKLYHLSRSTGEAPIKLFVRLVGEHGERVMVRVGGGWADLGEYLKEYASHHGRRSAADAGDKVEIQDLPPRIVSNSSTTSTLRGSGRDTPLPRPFSVLERERPSSSLNVRKTRKSIGDHDPSPIPSRININDTRSPSTPLPLTNRGVRAFETPPSVAASASSSNSGNSNGRSSRMSWTEEESSLGLAGPKSKKIVISERDQEWVESMKEKVRLASAEKEKRERERDRTASFGEMDKVGGTKRLFRRG